MRKIFASDTCIHLILYKQLIISISSRNYILLLAIGDFSGGGEILSLTLRTFFLLLFSTSHSVSVLPFLLHSIVLLLQRKGAFFLLACNHLFLLSYQEKGREFFKLVHRKRWLFSYSLVRRLETAGWANCVVEGSNIENYSLLWVWMYSALCTLPEEWTDTRVKK